MISNIKQWPLRQWFFYIKNREDKYFYQLLGMRRSGNHALMNWMLAQIPGKICFNNNMGAFHPPENTPIKKAVLNNGNRYNLMVSYENKSVALLQKEYSVKRYGKASQKFSILLLRDPLNWLASQYAWQEEQGHKFREDENFRNDLIKLYKEYARLFSEWETTDDSMNKVAVNYNEWVCSLEYRKKLADKLQLNFTDKGRDKVEKQGAGSSFSGTAIKGTEMKVLERWKKFKDDEFFLKLADDEMREIGRRVFGMGY